MYKAGRIFTFMLGAFTTLSTGATWGATWVAGGGTGGGDQFQALAIAAAEQEGFETVKSDHDQIQALKKILSDPQASQAEKEAAAKSIQALAKKEAQDAQNMSSNIKKISFDFLEGSGRAGGAACKPQMQPSFGNIPPWVEEEKLKSGGGAAKGAGSGLEEIDPDGKQESKWQASAAAYAEAHKEEIKKIAKTTVAVNKEIQTLIEAKAEAKKQLDKGEMTQETYEKILKTANARAAKIEADNKEAIAAEVAAFKKSYVTHKARTASMTHQEATAEFDAAVELYKKKYHSEDGARFMMEMAYDMAQQISD